MKLMERKLNEKRDNNLVWSSNAQQDYYFGMDKDELIHEIESMGEVEDFLRIRGYDDIEEADEDELISFLMPPDIDLDYEDFTESIMPMIKEQCANDILVLWGKAANWRGAYDAGAVIDVDDFVNYIYPNYDAISEIYSDNGNLYYIQYSHDTPTGGDTMYLYSFKSDELYDNACHICDEKDDDGDIEWLGEFKDDAGYAEIAKAIELGYLTPVTNKFNEGLEEGTKKGLKEQLYRYTFSNEDGSEAFSVTASSKDEAIAKGEAIEEKRHTGEPRRRDVIEAIAEDLYEKEDEFSFHFFSDDELALLWGLCISDGRVYDDEVFEAISDFPNSKEIFAKGREIGKKGFLTDSIDYESLRKTESLNEGRYSDYADDETRANGWWYFTTHGVGPGSIPKDLNVLEVREGQNKKGTWGDYVRLDGILNTDELDYYDMIELAPVEEEEDFTGFFSDYDFEESLDEDTVKTKSGKWVNKGDTGETHGEFKTKKEADAQRKAIFASGWKK